MSHLNQEQHEQIQQWLLDKGYTQVQVNGLWDLNTGNAWTAVMSNLGHPPSLAPLQPANLASIPTSIYTEIFESGTDGEARRKQREEEAEARKKAQEEADAQAAADAQAQSEEQARLEQERVAAEEAEAQRKALEEAEAAELAELQAQEDAEQNSNEGGDDSAGE